MFTLHAHILRKLYVNITSLHVNKVLITKTHQIPYWLTQIKNKREPAVRKT